jgi:hypothetical protein
MPGLNPRFDHRGCWKNLNSNKIGEKKLEKTKSCKYWRTPRGVLANVSAIGVNYGFSVRRTFWRTNLKFGEHLEDRWQFWRTFGGQLEIQNHPRVPPLCCFWIYFCNFLIQIFYPRVGHCGGQIHNL